MLSDTSYCKILYQVSYCINTYTYCFIYDTTFCIHPILHYPTTTISLHFPILAYPTLYRVYPTLISPTISFYNLLGITYSLLLYIPHPTSQGIYRCIMYISTCLYHILPQTPLPYHPLPSHTP